MKMIVLSLMIMFCFNAFASGSGGGGVDGGGGGKPTTDGRWVVDYGNQRLDLGKLIEGQMGHQTLTQEEINVLIGVKLKKKKIDLGELFKTNPDMDHIQIGDVVDFDESWLKVFEQENAEGKK